MYNLVVRSIFEGLEAFGAGNDSRQGFPFTMFNKAIFGERSPHISRIPFYDMRELLEDSHDFIISYVDRGARGIIFRLLSLDRKIDSTLKVVRYWNPDVLKILEELYYQSGIEKSEDDLKGELTGFESSYVITAHQVKGHILGNQIAPSYIDAPICAWVLPAGDRYQYVGYSLPFVDGESIRISEDDELMRVADEIELSSRVYVGNRGLNGNSSRNAVISRETEIKKFIDVSVRNKR